MNKLSNVDLAKDLPNERPTLHTSRSQNTKVKNVNSQLNPPTNYQIIETLISDITKTQGICIQELKEWIQDNPLPRELLKVILLTAKRLEFHPFMGHIDWELTPEKDWDIYISIDGWIALIHRQTSFRGITFNQSIEVDKDIPFWMECTIYRSDLSHPITVREYFAENKTKCPMWQIMPRRMLRHKTIQQCARLAFGITVPRYKVFDPAENLSKRTMSSQNETTLHSKQKLREKLLSDST